MRNQSRPPDLLRRFVATPYLFTNGTGPDRFSVQSNDLEIAIAIRRLWINETHGNRPAVVSWKILRDIVPPDSLAEISILHDKKLRTLMIGTGTILLFDLERAEFFGFICANITVQQLTSSLIPLLLEP
ncbi:hypothetical protein HDF12_002446 [Edaphobacter lichenicola]|uniref:Uncharacterized protein n=2 Tax=Tunturiibacter TaxID=3154218 RepID=A0A7Y9NMH0_9BACT|nr:hypothetical protein [Edaphobacter lichenicola]NYF52081.1 hypothetical protein [Edaphobacter lichenicola]